MSPEMRIAEFEIDCPPKSDIALPFAIRQVASPLPSLLTLLVVSPLAIILLLAAAMMVPAAAAETLPAAARATAAFNALTLLVLSTAIAGWPLRRMLDRLGRHRTVTVSQSAVRVTDAYAFGSVDWQRPLKSYRGLAHHVRSSLSGTRHELVLVHPDGDSSVLLATADRFAKADIEQLCRLLDVDEVSSAELYGNFGRSRLAAGSAPPAHADHANAASLRSAA